MSPVVDPGLCPQNHRCPLIESCPAEAISQEGFSLPQFEPDRCIECGRCVALCGMGAVHWAEES